VLLKYGFRIETSGLIVSLVTC